MQSRWSFETDAELDIFCQRIVAEMVAWFGISEAEAVGRINRHWHGHDFLSSKQGWLVYHEDAEYWAHVIYLGKDSYWWITGDKRKKMGLGPIQPKPYP